MAYQTVGKFDNAIGYTAVEHEFAGKDKKWNGQKRKHLHTANHFLEDDCHWQTCSDDR